MKVSQSLGIGGTVCPGVGSSGSKPYSLNEGIHTSWQEHDIKNNEKDISKSLRFVRGHIPLMSP